VIIAPDGQALPRETSARKTIFRKAVLANVPAAAMEQALKPNPTDTPYEEFFRDLLDEHFGREESRRQLETAIQWGRYAEISITTPPPQTNAHRG